MLPAIILFVVLASIVVVGYVLNAKTPKPEGCENLRADCEGCHDFGCSNNPAHFTKRED